VGWVLAPPAVREKLVIASEAQILCPSAYAQAAVSTYLSTMPWQDQLKAYREIYRERRDTMLGALADLMPAGTRWTRPDGGLFVWATLPGGLDAKAMVPRALRERVAYVPGTGFFADGTGAAHLRLNFSFSAPDRIREGIRRLAGVVEQELDLRAVFGTLPAVPAGTDRPASLLDVAEAGEPPPEGGS
jgi:DNA-binding transcriptional MocR family regulator